MKRFAPAILAAVVGSISVLAVAQNANASPHDDWHRYHHHDRDRDYWRVLLERTAQFLKKHEMSLADAVQSGWLDKKHRR